MRKASILSLFVLMGCATATVPASHWTPNEWKSTDAPVAKAAEPLAPTSTPETPPAVNPAPKDQPAPIAPPTNEPPPPVATLPAPQPVDEDKPAPETKPVDEKQVSRERAQAAITLLENTSGGVRVAVCGARGLLVQVPEAYRQEPLVVEAQKRLKAKEPAALREEQAEFEPNRMYLCRDGTPSPSCYCNGPKRGCCSHHKGVAGCEPLPTEISCP